MNPKLEEKISIALPKGTLLTIFEFLARSYESLRKDAQPANNTAISLRQPDEGERTALWHLECEIERTLPEIFSADYKQLISDWKRQLVSDNH